MKTSVTYEMNDNIHSHDTRTQGDNLAVDMFRGFLT